MDLPNAPDHRRPRRLLPTAAATVLLALGSAAPASPAQSATTPEIWFSPHAGHPPVPGAADYGTLFQESNPAWVAITSKFQVFVVGLDDLRAQPDSYVQQVATDLHSHNIAMALVIEGVAREATDTCGNGEGYESPLSVQAFAARLLRLNVRPDIVVMDGPLWYGHYNPKYCRFPVPVLIQRVATNLSFLTAAFPGMVYGETEGWVQIQDNPGWQHDYAQMRDGIQAATGVRLSFVHTDTNIHGHPNWPSLLVAAQAFVHQQGMKYGMIYDALEAADTPVSTDTQWIADAKAGIATMETQTQLIPDSAIIASWNPNPTHVLPATDPTTLSSLLLYYLSLPHTP